jgi:hypothetical protein
MSLPRSSLTIGEITTKKLETIKVRETAQEAGNEND